MAGPRPRVTAAVCAYNEAANIGRLLTTLLGRDSELFGELLVVSSASTDGTDAIVKDFEAAYPKLRLIVEAERRGKASAVNLVLDAARGDIVLLIDADCLPAEGAIAALLSRFEEPSVGGVGSRNVPVNRSESLVARSATVLWELHHEVNLRRPVLGGDIVAFRRVIAAIPADTINDDYAIEAALRGRGYAIAYEPCARTLMRVPASLDDFLGQRRRIHAGFRAESQKLARKATQDRRLVASSIGSLLRKKPGGLPWLVLLFALETAARTGEWIDELGHRRNAYTAWQPALSTKSELTDIDSEGNR
jgi:cellulose synthase/poly-beta-1,6-N-acetylglucosamine synthase-like glycosyltransferase